MLIFRTSAHSRQDFVDLASVSFTSYLGDLLSITEISMTGDSSGSSLVSGGTSILDTYRVYFNRQSYQVSTVVMSFFGFLMVWMLALSVFACLYRFTCEKHLDPAGFKARTEVKTIKTHQEKEDEEFMEEVIRKEQEGGANKSDSSAIIVGEVMTPIIKGFKARDKNQKLYDAENVSEAKLIASHNISDG